jgi:hypothetical protein
MDFRKIILAIMLISISIKGFSQDDVSHTFFARYNAIGNYKLENWVQDDFKQQLGYDIGYRFNYERIFASLSYQHYHGISTPESLSTPNSKRQFDLYANTYAMGFGYTIGHTDKGFGVAPFFNINFGDQVRLQSARVYVDGLTSYGSESIDNGTYLNGGTLGFEPGVLLKYQFKSGIAIECEISRLMISGSGGNFTDNSWFKAFGGGDTAGYDSQVSRKLTATKVLIGVSYTIF